MAIDWTGLRVVVTGGASGIGRKLAEGAAARGAKVAVADVEAERAEMAAAAIRATGGDASAFGCDVADPAAVDGLAAAAGEALGGVDMLFNNAGVGLAGRVERLGAANAAWIVSVNLMGVVHGVQSFAPLLRAAAADGRPAWIVNTGSEHSFGIPTIGASNVYTASKHAVLGLSDVLRHDFADSNVRIGVLCPGLVATEIYDAGRNRPETFGGAKRLPEAAAAQARAFMTGKGQDPALTAQLCFEGLDRGDFLIIADPNVRGFAAARIAEVEQAITVIERRLGSS